ncbi:MAG: hypothetical protein N3F66_10270 [Spirochaetes bacterium]|nr:hypothetical protein [Spirochaetota bacterium]
MEKMLHLILCIAMLSFTACIDEKLSQEEFAILWQEYLTREFIESFDEEQSSKQRREIMDAILQDYKVSPQAFYNYCKTKHPDKYALFDVNP